MPEMHRFRAFVTAIAFVAIALTAGGGGPASAQDDGDATVYAVRILEPFVVERSDGSLGGFSIDLARLIAELTDTDLEFLIVDSVGEQIAAVEDGRADAAIGAISITSERESRVDFSQPMFDSGIQIAVEDGSDRISFRRVLGALFSANILLLLLGVSGAAILIGTAVWMIERRSNPDFEGDGVDGVFSGIWWATVTLFTIGYGDQVPRRTASRLLAMVWMLIGVLAIATLTAEVTADVTVDRIESEISDVNDIVDKDVVTILGTTSEDFLRGNGIIPRGAETPDAAVRMVESGEAEAFVFDAAIIRYLVAEGGAMRLAGGVLQSESYGIVFPEGSDRVEAVDRALLSLRENGSYARLETAYFG